MKPKGDIDSAIAEIERQMANGEPINLSKTAGKFSVERSTLSRRIAGVSRSWEEYLSQQVQHLTNAQEKALIKRINYLSDKRMPPTCQIVKNLAEEICRHPVDKNYVNRFVHRHSNVLKSRYLRCIPIERVKAEYIPNFLYFFQLLLLAITDFHLLSSMIYNMDEKGFLIGHCHSKKRVFMRNSSKAGKLTQAIMDGARDFITLLCCICADGTTLPPTLIYPLETSKPLDTWTQDLEDDDELYMGCSPTGWSNNCFGLEWLKKVFIPYVRGKHSIRDHVLLILDGHSSHINMAFIEYAVSHRVILLILPPHTTHRLQPLDVGIFGPLAQVFCDTVNGLTNGSLGLVSMSKALFYSLFKPAFKKALSESNILSAFKKSGIWPQDPLQVTAKIERPITPPDNHTIGRPVPIPTPLTAKTQRQFCLDYRKNPTQAKTRKLFDALGQLQAALALSRYAEQGLQDAIIQQKKKKRGKPLLLTGEPDNGQAQLHSGFELRTAKAFQASLDAEKQAEQKRKNAKKINQERKKKEANEEKDRKAAERQITLEKRAQEAKEKAETAQRRKTEVKQKAEEKQVAKELTQKQQEEIKMQKAIAKTVVKPSALMSKSTAKKEDQKQVEQIEVGSSVSNLCEMTSRPSRTIRLPQRFKN